MEFTDHFMLVAYTEDAKYITYGKTRPAFVCPVDIVESSEDSIEFGRREADGKRLPVVKLPSTREKTLRTVLIVDVLAREPLVQFTNEHKAPGAVSTSVTGVLFANSFTRAPKVTARVRLST